MKITAVHIFEVNGVMGFPGEFWEERLIRPVDIYPEHKNQGAGWLPRIDDGHYAMKSLFCQVETDEGVTGLAGPTTMGQAYIILHQLAPMLIGADPRATERIWDRLYRSMVHGRKGESMMALSVVDCALWDLKGKWAGVPVYRLLGGPTRDKIPAYASMLGYSLEPELVSRRAKTFAQHGYKAQKWFFREGPTDGYDGVRKNVALVRNIREAVGSDVDIMLDCWMSWDVPYTIQMADRLVDFQPRWLEEPVLPDKIDQYAEIRRRVKIPISGGEHEYTRWGIKALITAGAVDVLQPDIYWAGGMTEMLKICALASAHDLPVIPHGHSSPASMHLIASQPVTTCPILEYLIKWNEIHQFFLKFPIQPVNGFVELPERPGLGMELDEAKIESREEISI
ncbi:MAG: enolase C-terminal domain-like protein [Anaerolineae bacterium]|nr:enolase C-terminal domain-like protein [Anaerolineae bacterium]